MAMWEIAVAVLAAMGAVAVGFVIPLLVRLTRSVEHVERLLREAELHLGPALADFQEIVRNLNKASAGVADGVARAGRALEVIGEIGKTLHGANLLLRGTLGPGVTVLAGLLAGAKAGGRVLLRRLLRRR
jgi:uncharacterized protein DUF948